MFDTIVVSDDDIERRNFLYEMLTELNYRVTTVFPKELTELLKRERPRWLILAIGGQARQVPAGQAPSVAAAARELWSLDRGLKLIVLAPPDQRQGLGSALTDDPRLTVLSAEADRLTLTRAILGALKARAVERVEAQTTFQGGILIVEDDPHAARFLTEYLQQRGYHATGVQTGEEALTQMRVTRWRLVILDLLLPGMDGLLTLRRLKTVDSSVGVIVTSAFEDEGLQREALQLGASAYLVKPFDLAKLEAAILTSTVRRCEN